MQTYIQTGRQRDIHVSLSICLSGCLYVSTYGCMSTFCLCVCLSVGAVLSPLTELEGPPNQPSGLFASTTVYLSIRHDSLISRTQIRTPHRMDNFFGYNIRRANISCTGHTRFQTSAMASRQVEFQATGRNGPHFGNV